ncbi:cytochrome P450 [Nocardioidaceae bacterium]|nr:cytochrome P450 [Nocardioidaceae bacterium]
MTPSSRASASTAHRLQDHPPRELPPSRREERGWPVVGAFPAYLRDPEGFLRRQYDRHGPVSVRPMIGGDWVFLLGPDASQAALTNRDKALANEPAWGFLVGPFFAGGLMLLDGAEHLTQRRLMQAAFTRDRLEGYTAAMHPIVDAALDRWQTGEGFLAHPALKELTLDIAARTFMGGADRHSGDAMDQVNADFIACVQAATALVRRPLPVGRWGRGVRARRRLETFLRGYLAEHRDAPGDDLFSALCQARDEDGLAFTDEQVVDHMVFLMMAAHDTSTSTLSAMLQFLGQHPEWQERCREEVLSLPERPGADDLDSLSAIDLVMKETLRLRPPVPVVVRRAMKETRILGVRIPAGANVTVSTLFTHLMPELWTDPERFDPDRFGPDRREDAAHRFAWEPFGGGVHKCLGMGFAGLEIKAVLCHLLRRFEVHVDPAYEAPLDFRSLPFPRDGQPVDLRPRPRRDPEEISR